MKKFVLVYIYVLTNLFVAQAQSIHHTPYDSMSHEIFRDTIFDKSIPPVQIDLLTYSNFKRITVGYELVLRDTELDIRDVELYVGSKQHKLNTLSPFRLHAGDSSETHRIDRVRVWNKFPFDTISTDTDSLVLITDRGNITLYLGEKLRREKALGGTARCVQPFHETDGRPLPHACRISAWSVRTYCGIFCIYEPSCQTPPRRSGQ